MNVLAWPVNEKLKLPLEFWLPIVKELEPKETLFASKNSTTTGVLKALATVPVLHLKLTPLKVPPPFKVNFVALLAVSSEFPVAGVVNKIAPLPEAGAKEPQLLVDVAFPQAAPIGS